jgi:uncharacterized linocin/CFP29 family protein
MQSMKRVGLATGTLTDYEVNYVETAITKTVRPLLIGRQLMPIRPLAHAGFRKYTFYKENDMGQAMISMTGEGKSEDIVDLTEDSANIPIISKDYTLHWRDVLMRRNQGEDLNTQHAENAARQVAEEEDKLILSGEYTGWKALGITGLATATSKQSTVGGDWSGSYLTYIAAAKALLRTSGYYGPYKLIMNSTWYGQLEALISNTEKWGFQAAGELIGGVENILVSDNLYASDGGTDRVLLVDVQPGNFELLIGADITNYLHQDANMNYKGKVWEAVVPVIKRGDAIVEINALT